MTKIEVLMEMRSELVAQIEALDRLGKLLTPTWGLRHQESKMPVAGGATETVPVTEQIGNKPQRTQRAQRGEGNESRDGSATVRKNGRWQFEGGSLAQLVREFVSAQTESFTAAEARAYVLSQHPDFDAKRLMGLHVTLIDLRDRGLLTRVGDERPARYLKVGHWSAEEKKTEEKKTPVAARYEEFRKGIVTAPETEETGA